MRRIFHRIFRHLFEHISWRALALPALLLLTYTTPVAADERLPASVLQALKVAGIPIAAVSVVVQEATVRAPRLSVNATAAFKPASVMKLLTTFAALDILGPAYTWKTEAWTQGTLHDGRLAGDLYLKGGGDPKLTFEQFWLLLRNLRARGLREIHGDLVLDRSRFQPDDTQSQFDTHPLRAYNVAPDALLLNFNIVHLQLVPDPARQRILVIAEPLPDRLDVISTIRLDDGACGDWKEALHTNVAERDGRTQLILSGNYASACGEQYWNLSMLPHARYVLGVFRELWQELGGSISGGLREAQVPPDAQLMATMTSPPLAEVVRNINKFSNNVMARQLFLTLAAEATNKSGVTTADSQSALRAWLDRKQFHFPELVLDNGAGLSRHSRISAASLTRLLEAAWDSPLMPEFVASLPLAAIDGTMKKRLGNTPAAGQAHIKTGSLEGVKSIAGYIRDRAGKWQIVVFLVNHSNARNAQAAQDALLQWVYERRS
jgi:D-alanyl-D-alanine carboxypeptidase/D-alanyl-D-alanine-endopeptidase (penicillin-binding protein 4)